MKLRSSKLIIKSDAQKQMIEFGFKCRFHDLKYFKVGIFHISYPLENIVTKFCVEPSIQSKFIIFQTLDNCFFNITCLYTTCMVCLNMFFKVSMIFFTNF